MRKEIEKLVNKTMLSKNRKAELIESLLILYNVRLSLPDAENVDYLRGFIDGYGGEEPHGVVPDGFNDINEVWDKMYELKGNEA